MDSDFSASHTVTSVEGSSTGKSDGSQSGVGIGTKEDGAQLETNGSASVTCPPASPTPEAISTLGNQSNDGRASQSPPPHRDEPANGDRRDSLEPITTAPSGIGGEASSSSSSPSLPPTSILATSTSQSEESTLAAASGPQPKSKVSAKRALQNRAAQRAFRQRRDEYVRTLEERTRHLEQKVDSLSRYRDEVRTLQQDVERLDREKVVLEGQVWNKDKEVGHLKGELGRMETENARLRGAMDGRYTDATRYPSYLPPTDDPYYKPYGSYPAHHPPPPTHYPPYQPYPPQQQYQQPPQPYHPYSQEYPPPPPPMQPYPPQQHPTWAQQPSTSYTPEYARQPPPHQSDLPPSQQQHSTDSRTPPFAQPLPPPSHQPAGTQHQQQSSQFYPSPAHSTLSKTPVAAQSRTPPDNAPTLQWPPYEDPYRLRHPPTAPPSLSDGTARKVLPPGPSSPPLPPASAPSSSSVRYHPYTASRSGRGMSPGVDLGRRARDQDTAIADAHPKAAYHSQHPGPGSNPPDALNPYSAFTPFRPRDRESASGAFSKPRPPSSYVGRPDRDWDRERDRERGVEVPVSVSDPERIYGGGTGGDRDPYPDDRNGNDDASNSRNKVGGEPGRDEMDDPQGDRGGEVGGGPSGVDGGSGANGIRRKSMQGQG